jgi:hypothetical protein
MWNNFLCIWVKPDQSQVLEELSLNTLALSHQVPSSIACGVSGLQKYETNVVFVPHEVRQHIISSPRQQPVYQDAQVHHKSIAGLQSCRFSSIGLASHQVHVTDPIWVYTSPGKQGLSARLAILDFVLFHFHINNHLFDIFL